MKYFVFILALLSLNSCIVPKAIQCDLEDGLEGTIAYGIETLGNCAAPAEVRKSVNSWVDKSGACSKSASMRTSGSICGAVVSALGAVAGNAGTTLLNEKFPQWQCDPRALISTLETIASAACVAVFPSAVMSK